MAGLFLGIDGGQSSTKAALGDAGRILGAGTAGPCNHVKEGDGRAKLVNAIEGALNAACQAAGLDRASLALEAACCGMSGGPADKDAILREILPARTVEVTTDAHIALYGAMAGGPGIIVIAGTGSIALGVDEAGRVARAGGWGYLFGDEGGAFDLVRQAVRAALRMEEGWGPETALLARLLEASGAPSANDLMHWLYGDEWPRSRVGKWAALVDAAAETGDAQARLILENGAADLAQLADAVRANLFGQLGAEVALIGGVFRSELLRTRAAKLVEAYSGDVAEPRMTPAEGALVRARKLMASPA